MIEELYVPNKCKIPDKVCIVGNTDYLKDNTIWVNFSSKIDNPPAETLLITDNIFAGDFHISTLHCGRSGFFATLFMDNVKQMGIQLRTSLSSWVINDLIFSGLLQENGVVKLGTEFCVAFYSGHNSMVLKDKYAYNQIRGI